MLFTARQLGSVLVHLVTPFRDSESGGDRLFGTMSLHSLQHLLDPSADELLGVILFLAFVFLAHFVTSPNPCSTKSRTSSLLVERLMSSRIMSARSFGFEVWAIFFRLIGAADGPSLFGCGLLIFLPNSQWHSFLTLTQLQSSLMALANSPFASSNVVALFTCQMSVSLKVRNLPFDLWFRDRCILPLFLSTRVVKARREDQDRLASDLPSDRRRLA